MVLRQVCTNVETTIVVDFDQLFYNVHPLLSCAHAKEVRMKIVDIVFLHSQAERTQHAVAVEGQGAESSNWLPVTRRQEQVC